MNRISIWSPKWPKQNQIHKKPSNKTAIETGSNSIEKVPWQKQTKFQLTIKLLNWGAICWINFCRYSPQFLKASKAVPVSLARQRYPRPTAEELAKFLNDSISFLIVRHPFERLLSAYRNKLEQSLPHTFHSKLGMHIVAQFRVKVKLLWWIYYGAAHPVLNNVPDCSNKCSLGLKSSWNCWFISHPVICNTNRQFEN